MADQLFIIIDAEGFEIGVGTHAEIADLARDGILPALETLTLQPA